ncbi:MAG: PIN domain-containing protein [Chitinophagales bacterium]|nr:PIN domain-containing protein [Chitinophagales bacterium]
MKIFIDTAPFIYLVENHPVFAKKMKTLITDAIVNGEEIITNVVTISEYGVKPTRENRPDLIKKFEELLARLNVEVLIIDQSAARKAYELRAKYQFLKGMDAFQLALSINEKCHRFITNDKRLKKISEISIDTMDDL